jgi:hypothetical protein
LLKYVDISLDWLSSTEKWHSYSGRSDRDKKKQLKTHFDTDIALYRRGVKKSYALLYFRAGQAVTL